MEIEALTKQKKDMKGNMTNNVVHFSSLSQQLRLSEASSLQKLLFSSEAQHERQIKQMKIAEKLLNLMPSNKYL